MILLYFKQIKITTKNKTSVNILPQIDKKTGVEQKRFQHHISSILGRFCANFEVKRGQKAVPEGGRFLRWKMVAAKSIKNRKNRAQEAMTIIGLSYSVPISPLGGRGETTKLTKNRLLIVSARLWAKGPANSTNTNTTNKTNNTNIIITLRYHVELLFNHSESYVNM